MRWPRRYGGRVERSIDAIVFGILIVVAIRTTSNFTRVAAVIGAALLLLGWFVAWRRGR